MNEALHLSQQQALAQTLAPLQVQYVKMLEMNAAAIEDEVRRRLDENPAIEVADSSTNAEASGYETSRDSVDYDAEDDHADSLRRMRSGTSDTAAPPIEANAAIPDLAESLRTQLAELDLDATTRALATYIIGSLDSNGRLTRTPRAIAGDIAIHTGTDIPDEMVARALRAVQSLDPAGVAAADLRECLLLQLMRRPESAEQRHAAEILSKHFDLFAAKHFDRLRSRMGISNDDLHKAVEFIRTLNPKPGNSEASSAADRSMHITPDFVVEPDENDPEGNRMTVSLAGRIPELALSQSYDTASEEAIPGARNTPARTFIRTRRQEALEFIDLIARRNSTMMAVMQAIVKLQRDFFRTEDPSLIRPMILKDVAAITGRDMSVISRAANGKYVATPGGVYPLKMFFNERPHDDSDISTHRILTALRALIDSEDKRRPLSDDALTDMLAAQGLDVARRTVAKYREQMNIPNSRGRREMAPRNTRTETHKQ